MVYNSAEYRDHDFLERGEDDLSEIADRDNNHIIPSYCNSDNSDSEKSDDMGDDDRVMYNRPPPLTERVISRSLPEVPSDVIARVNEEIWHYLGQGSYNCVTYTKSTYPFGDGHYALVKKESFPSQEVYIYHTQQLEFEFQWNKQRYACFASAHETGLRRIWNHEIPPDTLEVRRHFFILNPSGLYEVKLIGNLVQMLDVDVQHIRAITQVVMSDPRASTKAFFNLTARMVMQVKAICPTFCEFMSPSLPSYNQKTRTAQLLSTLYPELPVYVTDEHTLVMPYFENAATADEIITEQIRVFKVAKRFFSDACIMENTRKDQFGNVRIVDPDMLFDICERRRWSRGSLDGWDMVYSSPTTAGQQNEYGKLLVDRMRASNEERRIVVVTYGLQALAANFDSQNTPYDHEMIDENLLKLVLFFSQRQFPLTVNDLKVMHAFPAVLLRSSLGNSDPTVAEFYYGCLLDLVFEANDQNINGFLGQLEEDTRIDILIIAVQKKSLVLVDLLLIYGVNPLICGASYSHALDWAILMGDWGIIEKILAFVPAIQHSTLNRNRVWAFQFPTMQEVIELIKTLEVTLQFHHHLNLLWDFSVSRSDQTLAEIVLDLVQVRRDYFITRDQSLSERKNKFIHECLAILTRKTAITEGAVLDAMHDLKNALSLARRSNISRCTMS